MFSKKGIITSKLYLQFMQRDPMVVDE